MHDLIFTASIQSCGVNLTNAKLVLVADRATIYGDEELAWHKLTSLAMRGDSVPTVTVTVTVGEKPAAPEPNQSELDVGDDAELPEPEGFSVGEEAVDVERPRLSDGIPFRFFNAPKFIEWVGTFCYLPPNATPDDTREALKDHLNVESTTELSPERVKELIDQYNTWLQGKVTHGLSQ